MYGGLRTMAVRGDPLGAVAQLVAHRTGSAGVTGSSPVSSTTFCACTFFVAIGSLREFK